MQDLIVEDPEPWVWGVCPFCWLPYKCFHPNPVWAEEGDGPEGCFHGQDPYDCDWADCWRCSGLILQWGTDGTEDANRCGTIRTNHEFLAPRLPGGPLQVTLQEDPHG